MIFREVAFATGLGITAFGVAACGGNQEVPAGQIEALQKHVDGLVGEFGCQTVGRIVIELGENEASEDGLSRAARLEQDGRTITVYPPLFELQALEADGAKLSVMEHEFAHGCRVERVFDEPIELKQTGLILNKAFGFRLHFEPSGGDTGIFEDIEEGFATYFEREVNGQELNPEAVRYESIGDLFQYRARLSGATPAEINNLQDNSDIYGLVSVLYGIDRDAVGPDQIEGMVIDFNNADNFGHAYLLDVYPDIGDVIGR